MSSRCECSSCIPIEHLIIKKTAMKFMICEWNAICRVFDGFKGNSFSKNTNFEGKMWCSYEVSLSESLCASMDLAPSVGFPNKSP